jgi:hypothetical protein
MTQKIEDVLSDWFKKRGSEPSRTEEDFAQDAAGVKEALVKAGFSLMTEKDLGDLQTSMAMELKNREWMISQLKQELLDRSKPAGVRAQPRSDKK